MRASSDLLFRIATVLDSAGRPFTLDGSESELAFPSIIHPVLEVPGAINAVSAFSAADTQRESFVRDDTTARANQAATTILVATFGAGVWRVQVTLAVLGNWTQPSDGTLAGGIILQDPENVNEGLLPGHIVTNVPMVVSGVWTWAFIRDGMTLRTSIPANGVGQTHEFRTFVVATRLV